MTSFAVSTNLLSQDYMAEYRKVKLNLIGKNLAPRTNFELIKMYRLEKRAKSEKTQKIENFGAEGVEI